MNFDWGYGSPDPQIPVDNFSATYEKSMSFDGGIYEITGQSDDLVKVSIDGNVVYDVTKPGNHSLSKFQITEEVPIPSLLVSAMFTADDQKRLQAKIEVIQRGH